MRRSRFEKNFSIATVVVVAVIIYGSLFPFTFRWPIESPGRAARALCQAPGGEEVSRDGERLIELVSELATRMGNLVSDMVPPSAQVHLLNAQRELITALVLIYEHRVATGADERPRRGAAPARRAPARRRATRVGKIPIE